MNFSAPVTIADRLGMTLDGLCRAVAARIAPGIAGWAMQAAMIVLVWGRIRRIEGKIQTLLARFQAGRLWDVPTRVRPVSVAGGGVVRRPLDPAVKLPRSFGWLIRLVPYQAAGFGSQLRCVLGEPEMVALLAASAQARRVLAPLCRMLAIEADVLGPGVLRPGVEALVCEGEPPVVRVRVRKPRAPVDWGRIPIPRGVISAVRRRGFLKD